MKHLTLKKLREQKGWSVELASKIYGIKARVIKDYEEYRVIPRVEDVAIILKSLGLYYFEIMIIIFDDYAIKYRKY